MGLAIAPAARQTLRRAPLRLISENMVMAMKVLIETDIVLGASVGGVQMNDLDQTEDGKAFFISMFQC